jgi:adenine specific DNA methylase Mod
MPYRITDIEFDFDDDIDEKEQDEIYEEVCSTSWIVKDEEDLVEEITNATGWCIKSIDYRIILS